MGMSDDPMTPPRKPPLPYTSGAGSVLTLIFPIFLDLGNLYHHLLWFGDKPVAAVTSLWEDAGHRWDSLNLLRALCHHLVRSQIWGMIPNLGEIDHKSIWERFGAIPRRGTWPSCRDNVGTPPGTAGGSCCGSWNRTASEQSQIPTSGFGAGGSQIWGGKRGWQWGFGGFGTLWGTVGHSRGQLGVETG